MNTRLDPTTLRWLIGGELAQLRERGGLSMAEAAEATGLTKTKIGHLEIGRLNQSPDDIELLLGAYESPSEDVERLMAAATKPHGKPWWHRWKAMVPNWFGQYLGLEGMAVSLFGYELAAVPGLLQTRDYARAITSQSMLVSEDSVDRTVSLRMARAERITQEPTLNVHLVLDETALHRQLPDNSIMAEQCEHLLAMGDRPNVTVQVVEANRGMHGELGMGNFAILDFAQLRSVVYSEIYGDALYLRDLDKVRSYQLAAERIQSIALPPEETRKLIFDLRRRYA